MLPPYELVSEQFSQARAYADLLRWEVEIEQYRNSTQRMVKIEQWKTRMKIEHLKQRLLQLKIEAQLLKLTNNPKD